jgi:hypothetical protein
VATDDTSVAGRVTKRTAAFALLETWLARYGVEFVRAIVTDCFFASQPRA